MIGGRLGRRPTCPQGNNYAAVVKADNPTYYWRYNESTGTTAVDTMGHNNGTYGITRTQGRTGPDARDSTSLAFGNLSTLPGVTLGGLALLTHTIASFEFWVRCTENNIGLWRTFNGATQGYSFGVGFGGTAGTIAVWDSAGAAWKTSSGTTTVTDGNWHHVVVTFSGTTCKTYIDNVLTGTITLAGAVTPQTVSCDSSRPTSQMLALSDVAVYDNVVLSTTQIANHYNAAKVATNADRTAVLSSGVAWEQNAVYEPNVWWDGTQWNMIYTGGFASARLGYATATTPLGTWTKNAGNPIIGGGNGGQAGNIARGTILLDGGTLYVFFATPYTGANSPDILVVSGTDALHLGTTASTALTHTASAIALQNCWVINDGGTYKMLFESRVAGSQWKTGYATASSPAGPYTIQNFPLDTLQPGGAGVSYSAAWFAKINGLYHFWYHISGNGSATLPTDIYRATSSDCVTWYPDARPVIGRKFGVDQAGDANLVIDGAGFGFKSGAGNFAFWEEGDDNAGTFTIYGSSTVNGFPDVP